MIKLMVMIKRRSGMSKEAFDRYWSGPHAEQVLGCPDFVRHVRRYVQSHVVTREGIRLAWGVSDYDGQAELWFDSVDAMNAAFNEPGFLASVVRDLSNSWTLTDLSILVGHPEHWHNPEKIPWPMADRIGGNGNDTGADYGDD